MLKVGLLIILAAVALAGIGIGGHALGSAQAPGEDDRAAAFEQARQSAYEDAEEGAFDEGRERGIEEGLAKGRRDGQEEGRADALAAVEDRQAEAAVAAPEPAVPGPATPAPVGCDPQALPTPPGCPVPPDGPCGLYLELQDGQCVQPAPDPATPEECPPGSVPAGVTGACAPRE